MDHHHHDPDRDSAPESTTPDGLLEARLRLAFADGTGSGNHAAGAAPCPSHETLAAFVDGRLRADDRIPVEAHLASCGACLAACGLALRVTADDRAGLLDAPRATVERAIALAPAGDHVGEPPRVLLFDAWRVLGRWSLAAAASLAICLAGYHVGRAACADRTSTSDLLLTEMTFGVIEIDAGDEPFLDAFAIATEETS